MRAYAEQTRRAPRDRDRLIIEHLEIARRISLRVARRCPAWITADDLVAAGMLGLAEAAERYDDSRQEPFLVFAEKRIRGAVLDELRRGDIMPRRSRQMARKIGAVIAGLERTHGEGVSDEQVAEALGVSVSDYRENLEHLVHVTVGSLELLEHNPRASTDESPRQHSERREILGRIRAALGQLGQRDALVLSLYYNDEMTYVEIADVLGVTTSRVCQLHGRAIARLRAALETVAPEAQTRLTAGAEAFAALEADHG